MDEIFFFTHFAFFGDQKESENKIYKTNIKFKKEMKKKLRKIAHSIGEIIIKNTRNKFVWYRSFFCQFLLLLLLLCG